MQASVLVVEDESLIAMLIEDHLVELGYDVAPAVSTVAGALAALDIRPPDVALLDVNLGGTMSFPVAEALRSRGIPFLFLTGYGRAGIPAEYADCLVVQKPFRRKDLEAHLTQLLHGVPAEAARVESGWSEAAVLAKGAPLLPDQLNQAEKRLRFALVLLIAVLLLADLLFVVLLLLLVALLLGALAALLLVVVVAHRGLPVNRGDRSTLTSSA